MHDASPGMGFAGRGQNQGLIFVKLRDWELRDRPDLRAQAVANRAMRSARRASAAPSSSPSRRPPSPSSGVATGFDLMLQDRGGLGHEKLTEAQYQLLGMAAKDPRLARVQAQRHGGRADVQGGHRLGEGRRPRRPGQLHPELPLRRRSAAPTSATSSRAGGSSASTPRPTPRSACCPSDLDRLHVRNRQGELVPLSAVASGRWVYGSPRLERYNGFPAMNIQGEAAPGHTTGEAMQAMEELMAKLPQGVGYEWTGLSYQQRMSESQAGLLYAFSILVIFLVLAALYESWTVPISVMLALPLGVIGGVLASSLRGMPNDVYFQIGLLTVLGLTTKNAILIVQFATKHMEQGMGLIEATLEAAKLRLRPIVMTSLAFGFGVLPLAIASGAGAGAMKAIGTSVLGGMITATFLAIFFIPLFFVLVVQVFGSEEHHRGRRGAAAEGATDTAEGQLT